jgi:hypothetical protein
MGSGASTPLPVPEPVGTTFEELRPEIPKPKIKQLTTHSEELATLALRLKLVETIRTALTQAVDPDKEEEEEEDDDDDDDEEEEAAEEEEEEEEEVVYMTDELKENLEKWVTNAEDGEIVPLVVPEILRLLLVEKDDEPVLEQIYAARDLLPMLPKMAVGREAPVAPLAFTEADMLRHVRAAAAPEPIDQRKQIEAQLKKAPWYEIGDTWYLVSTKWLKGWRTYTKQVAFPPVVPGPITQADILAKPRLECEVAYVGVSPRLDFGKAEGPDFEIFPLSAWELLLKWYTGVAIPRVVSGFREKKPEIYPAMIGVWTRGLVDVDVGVSRFETVGELKRLACAYYSEKAGWGTDGVLEPDQCRIWDEVDGVPKLELKDKSLLCDTQILKDHMQQKAGPVTRHKCNLREMNLLAEEQSLKNAEGAGAVRLDELAQEPHRVMAMTCRVQQKEGYDKKEPITLHRFKGEGFLGGNLDGHLRKFEKPLFGTNSSTGTYFAYPDAKPPVLGPRFKETYSMPPPPVR